MALPIADAHTDVLMRMEEEHLRFDTAQDLAAGQQALRAGNVRAQVFALFVWPKLPATVQMEQVLREIDLFYQQLTSNGVVLPVRTWAEFESAQQTGKIAGLLSVEGGGCLRGQVELLRTMYHLGVRGMGLTWNGANELADGCRERRGAGLTAAGREVVLEMVRLGMWVDIAHLADRGVEDIFALTNTSVMASHANARAVHNHPRNLTDDVIREVIRRNGWIGLTFEASFLGEVEQAGVDDVFRHLDHLLKLGAEDCVGFGSDFDGTSHAVSGLSSAADYAQLSKQLVERYGQSTAEKICSRNFERYLRQILR